MSCLAEDRFIELLDQGGLEATKPGERAHLESCEACRDSWAGVAAAAEVLAEARPRSAGRAARWIPLGAAAAMLLVVLGVIATRSMPSPLPTPKPDPVAIFLDGPAVERAAARAEILKLGRQAIPGLVAARARFQGSPRFKDLQALLWDLKSALRQDARDERVRRTLETRKLDLSFQGAGAQNILAFINDFSALNVLLDPTLKLGAIDTFSAENQTLRETLEILCFVTGLDFDVRNGVVVVSTPLRLWSTDPKVALRTSNLWRTQVSETDATARKLSTVLMTIDMQQTPLSTFCDFLTEHSGVKIRTGAALGSEVVGVRIHDLTLDHLLEFVTLPRGWDVRIEGDELVIFKREE